MQLLCGCHVATGEAHLQIQEEAKSLCDNVKQKEGEGSNAGKCNASKGWFDNFTKSLGFEKPTWAFVKTTGEAASAKPRGSGQLPLRSH